MEDNPDFGPPIVCQHFDLQAGLIRENAERIAREDQGLHPDEDEHELELPTPPSNSPTPTSILTASSPTLSRVQKKKLKKREHEHKKRQADARLADDDPLPPTPTPSVLAKAAAASPLHVPFSATDFRSSKPRWTGLQTPLEHPLLAYARDVEFLKSHMQYADWAGEKTHAILDSTGHIIGSLIAPPLPGKAWTPVNDDATAAMRLAREEMSFPADACHHRRAYDDEQGFPAAIDGFGFGGGRTDVGNFKMSARHRRAMDKLIARPSIRRTATYGYGPFQALCYPIHSQYYRTTRELRKKHPGLRRLFPRSPFAALTANLGPHSVSPPHADHGNATDGMCLISALGHFDPDKGGHLVLWDYNLIIRFPPGCSILIPSTVVTHSNTPIQAGEERFSLIQYSAGGLFRWAANGFKSDVAWAATASEEDVAAREQARQARWATALKKFSLLKDVKMGNYAGRVRAELWAEAEAGDISDLTDVENEGGDGDDEEEEPLPKKIRCA
ncbi:hypothetical protein FB45DRAFT_873539 [Roridomyces roridus]|uniref:Uncharacterized protein n=1 Tax=Roridomyces roridus TaxID=1738132 RepID=A0AAD7BAC2_9AGAR|nr:hypothetical protein FB45DRAFT_873539 [Roridomyces roridus]